MPQVGSLRAVSGDLWMLLLSSDSVSSESFTSSRAVELTRINLKSIIRSKVMKKDEEI